MVFVRNKQYVNAIQLTRVSYGKNLPTLIISTLIVYFVQTVVKSNPHQDANKFVLPIQDLRLQFTKPSKPLRYETQSHQQQEPKKTDDAL